ncbi:MAG: hypothetical protein ACI8UO_000056 [Verrucomicrobiales bacterium]
MKSFFRNDLGKIRFEGYEWLIMRIGFALIALHTAYGLKGEIIGYDRVLKEPKSLATWFNIDFMGNDVLVNQLQWVFVVLMVLYVLQVIPSLAVLGMLSIYSLAGAFYASNGSKPHHLQLVSYMMIGQVFASIVQICRQPSWKSFLMPAGLPREAIDGFRKPSVYRDRCVFYGMQMLAAAYVITGLSKLVRSEWTWIQNVPNLVVQIEKTLKMDYYNTLKDSDDRAARGMIELVSDHPYLGMIIFGGALLTELFAFLALFNRALLLFFGFAIIALHKSIGAVMDLHFFSHEVIALLFFINLPFWTVAICKKFKKQPIKLA